MNPNSALAEAFFAAVARGDAERARALCAPGFQASQNGGPAVDVEALVALGAAIRAVAPNFRYENAVRSETATGFVEEHEVRGTLPDGTPFQVAVCVVARVVDGKIAAVNEYLDIAAAAGLSKALRG